MFPDTGIFGVFRGLTCVSGLGLGIGFRCFCLFCDVGSFDGIYVAVLGDTRFGFAGVWVGFGILHCSAFVLRDCFSGFA